MHVGLNDSIVTAIDGFDFFEDDDDFGLFMLTIDHAMIGIAANAATSTRFSRITR